MCVYVRANLCVCARAFVCVCVCVCVCRGRMYRPLIKAVDKAEIPCWNKEGPQQTTATAARCGDVVFLQPSLSHPLLFIVIFTATKNDDLSVSLDRKSSILIPCIFLVSSFRAQNVPERVVPKCPRYRLTSRIVLLVRRGEGG